MRRAPVLLSLFGIIDVIAAVLLFVMHALAFATQYSGLCFWLNKVTAAAPGSAESERTRIQVLELLNRTSLPVIVLSILLLVSGIIMILVGWRMACRRNRSLSSGAVSPISV